jgi:hypothetical protein
VNINTLTAVAPGVFAEVQLEGSEDEKVVHTAEYPIAGVHHPCKLGQCLLLTICADVFVD